MIYNLRTGKSGAIWVEKKNNIFSGECLDIDGNWTYLYNGLTCDEAEKLLKDKKIFNSKRWAIRVLKRVDPSAKVQYMR